MPQMMIHLRLNHHALPILLLEDVHDSGNAKVEDAPPHIPHGVPPDVVVCIDQREHFTTT